MNKRIIVTSDGWVNVDGQAYEVDLPLKPGVHALRWEPGQNPKGFIEQVGDSHGFSDYSLIELYLGAWERAKAKAEEKAAAEEAEAKAEFEKRKAEAEKQAQELKAAEEKFKAQQQDWAAYAAALNRLGSGDHEVIKAVEAKLAAEGALSKDFVDMRNVDRAVARSEKKRLQGNE